MDNELKKIIKNLNGYVLTIGLDDNYIKYIEQNNNIIDCYCLNNASDEGNEKGKKGKTIYINKIRKKFKKKNIDYIICNYDVIKKYMKTFIKDSVYINKNKLYYYGDIDYEIISKYKRYKSIINKINSIVEIDNSNSNNNIFK